MDDQVIFEDDNIGENRVGNIQIVPGAPTGMLAWLVKNQVVKNAKQAETFLLGLAIACVVLAVVVFVIWGTSHPHVISEGQLDLTKFEQLPSTSK